MSPRPTRSPKEKAIRRELYIAAALGLPYGWRLRQTEKRLTAWGREPLPCGHQTVSAVIHDGDLLTAAALLVSGIRLHASGV